MSSLALSVCQTVTCQVWQPLCPQGRVGVPGKCGTSSCLSLSYYNTGRFAAFGSHTARFCCLMLTEERRSASKNLLQSNWVQNNANKQPWTKCRAGTSRHGGRLCQQACSRVAVVGTRCRQVASLVVTALAEMPAFPI